MADEAIATLDRARSLAIAIGDGVEQAYISLALAQIDMGTQNFNAAHDGLKDAIAKFVVGEDIRGEVNATALLAQCAGQLGMKAERDQLAVRARDLRSRVTLHQQVFLADLALAHLDALNQPIEGALESLQALIDDAQKRQWTAYVMEGKVDQSCRYSQGGKKGFFCRGTA